VQLLFGLAQAFEMLNAEGLDNVFERHRLLAEATRQAVAVWSRGKAVDFNIKSPDQRSDTVTTVLITNGQDPHAVLDYCATKCGVVLGQGIGALSGKAFRIAHMGHINAPMMLGILGVVEMALTALDIPHRKGGLEAAVTRLGQAVRP
jgi:alanine-glyoxylate transaminase/serine-glyoxylate transaminase/serine-pyruvate transaminase